MFHYKKENKDIQCLLDDLSSYDKKRYLNNECPLESIIGKNLITQEMIKCTKRVGQMHRNMLDQQKII